MKIVIPVEVNNEKTEINKHLGRTPYFLIKDTEEDSLEFLRNEAADSSGGAGVKAAQAIVDMEPDVLLAPRSGNKATEILEESNIRIYKTEGTDWKENIELLKENKLDILVETKA